MGAIRNNALVALLIGSLVVCSVVIYPASKINLAIGILSGLIAVSLLFLYKKKWLLYITVAAIPLSTGAILPGTGMSVSLPSELLCVVLSVYMIAQLVRNKLNAGILKHPITVLLLFDLLWLGITTVTSTSPDVSVKRLIIRVVFFLVFYLLIASFSVENKVRLLKLYLLYLFGLIPVMYFTFRKHMHYDFDLRAVFEVCAPYYNDHTIYAACLAFVIPIGLVVLWNARTFKLSTPFKVFLFLVFLFLISQEILALSRAALMSLGAALLFYLFLKTKWKSYVLYIIVAGILVVGFTYRADFYDQVARNEAVSNDGDVANHFTSVTNVKTDASNLERINRWVCAFEMFKEKPLTGFGPGTYQFEYGQFQTSEFKTYISTNHGDRGNAHSEYLTYLSETGLPGFLIFLAIVLYTIHVGIRAYHKALVRKEKVIVLGILLGLVTFYVHGLVNAFFDQEKMAFLVYAALATIVVFDLKQTGKLSPENEKVD